MSYRTHTRKSPRAAGAIVSLALALSVCSMPGFAADPVVNSLGIKMIPVPAGEFIMGSAQRPPLPAMPVNKPVVPTANWDELPTHRVSITKPFLMAETEVTAEQYHQFKPDAPLNDKYAPYAAGMSWKDAVAFCDWLSKKEGKNYRLPTEAEWEYTARAGKADGATWVLTDHDANPWGAKDGVANSWGIKDMLTGPLEWCSDWYGEYDFPDQKDPVGPAAGFMKVARGGYLDEAAKFAADNYFRPSARAAIAPSFGPYDGPNPKAYGVHRIGIRLVQADAVTTPPVPYVASFVRQGVIQSTADAAAGPDMSKPYFHRRRMLPIPPEDERNQAVIDHAGLHPSFRFHSHSPGFEVLPNGDCLLVIYTSYFEYEPEVSLISARLRAGAEEWDMPTPFIDTAGANDHAPLLSVHDGTLRLFWGNPYAEGHFPFQYIESKDLGANWSEVHYPHITGPLGQVLERPQPITSVLYDKNGTMFVPVDAGGGAVDGVAPEFTASHSLLWATNDNGTTWRDTIGRTFGRHTAFVLGKDGTTIIGIGGKNVNIDNYMPKSISTDGGKTYEYSKTPFAQLMGGQRPCVLRLKSGRIFFASDLQASRGAKPEDIKGVGSLVALSDDEGQTWHIKRLPGAESTHATGDHVESLGYCCARQAPNGLINLITSLNHPALHFQMNEAWILSDTTMADDDPKMDANTATKLTATKPHQENYADGKPKIAWTSGQADDGRVELDGTETWYFPSGAKQYEATYKVGVRVGLETYWSADGKKVWEWNHKDDGTSDWTTYWSDGTKRSESTWKNHELIPGTDKFYEHAMASAK